MTSEQWLQLRVAWFLTFRERKGREPQCAVCDKPLTLRSAHLHHVAYDRFGGKERFEDLMPFCPADHELLHGVFDRSSGYQRMSRRAATLQLVSRLRRLRSSAPATNDHG
ncbi:HNH endonuclease signature motif containing protein [Paenarthrobacter sp. NPDC056912]|uniref:HNH endonuclease signature motif containing protein n=1 Tax=Paenarthrobacter sp. NPDC056912 TaxID=3345965 RepID=UPI003672B2BF